MGSNKLIQVALGKTSADEYKTNLSQLSGRLKGNVGLFFTKLPQEEVSAWLHACVSEAVHVNEKERALRASYNA